MLKTATIIRLLIFISLFPRSGLGNAAPIDLECFETEYPWGGAMPPQGKKYFDITIDEQLGIVYMLSGNMKLQVSSPTQFSWSLGNDTGSSQSLWVIDRRTGRFTVDAYVKYAGTVPMARGVCNKAEITRKF